MALKKYVGPQEAVKLTVAGVEFGVVEKGGSVAVPDELANSVGWSADLWEDGAKAPARPESRKEVK
jgi:hypothetical protein